MYSKIIKIDKPLALEYLAHNKVNRVPTKRAIDKYAEDMKRGRWELSPDGISFNVDGELINGQHRLMAIVKADVAVEMYVTFDVPNTVFEFDRQVARTQAHILQMRGVDKSIANHQVCSIVNFLYFMYGKSSVPDSVVFSFVEDNAELLLEAARIARVTSKNNNITRSAPIMAAVYCALVSGINRTVLYNMFQAVNTGFTNNSTEFAAIVLRNYILSPEYNSSNHVNRKHTFAVVTHAINDYVNTISRTRKYKADLEPLYFQKVKREQIEKYL